MKDMSNVMSKFLLMGMKIEDVIRLSTWNPAKQMKREDLGHLSIGAAADVAVFKIRTGQFVFTDVYGAKAMGAQKIEVELTVRDGVVAWDLNGISRPVWDKLGPSYETQTDRRWDGTFSSGGSGGRRQRRP